MLNLQKKKKFSFHSPIFDCARARARVCVCVCVCVGLNGGITKANVRWEGAGVHLKRTGTNKWDGGQKLEISSERTFWMPPT